MKATRSGTRQCLTTTAAAEYLRITDTTARELFATGAIAAFPVGPPRLWRVTPDDLERYIAEAKCRPHRERS